MNGELFSDDFFDTSPSAMKYHMMRVHFLTYTSKSI